MSFHVYGIGMFQNGLGRGMLTFQEVLKIRSSTISFGLFQMLTQFSSLPIQGIFNLGPFALGTEAQHSVSVCAFV